jgi:hypothetical protein
LDTITLIQLWVGPQEDEIIISNPRLFWWVLLTFCVQPAIVEELFVRYLMLGISSATYIHRHCNLHQQSGVCITPFRSAAEYSLPLFCGDGIRFSSRRQWRIVAANGCSFYPQFHRRFL